MPAPTAPRAAILEQYVRNAPSDANALDLFKGEWWSAFPAQWASLQAGNAQLFEDRRLHWAIEALGGVAGRAVLELGPLEGGHTWMLEQAGARSVVAIEANSRSYLKCLIVKEMLGSRRSRFLLGDFEVYLRDSTERFDAVFACGVLYHVRDPVDLLHDIARAADSVYVWTHYYAGEVISANPNTRHRFPACHEAESHGFRHTLHRYEYRDYLDTNRFNGGTEEFSHWLTREDLLGALRHVGFSEIVIGEEDPAHPHGPCISLVARRPR